MMETRELWARILKTVRESGDPYCIGLLSNLNVSFTHDTITIKVKKEKENSLTTEQKLINLFGDKYEQI